MSEKPLLIDIFPVVEVLHSGQWGDVYRVRPDNLDRNYALKLASPGEAEARLHNERAALEKIGHHPNITQIYFAGSWNDRPYIVEDLADQTLRQYLKTYKGTFGSALNIIKQLIDAVGFAHKNGIIHRDLKPENILLKGKGQPTVLLCDFGLSEQPKTEKGLESSLEDASVAAGTVQYLSPEQRNGEKVDHRSDLYTIGLIFYEMLTGRKPTINLLKPTEIMQEFPSWIDDFILRALKPNPQDRYQSAEEMLQAIQTFTAAPTVVPPTRSQLFWAGTHQRVAAVANFTKKGIFHTLMLPIYILILPFILGYHIVEYSEKNRIGELGFGFSAALVLAYYMIGVPNLAEYYLRHEMAQAPPSGTIIYYCNQDSQDRGKGFHFARASGFPEIDRVIIPTPEISNTDFRPQFTLSEEGQIFYYTTPTGLVKIDLSLPQNTPGFRTVIVNSEVFNYFTQLCFVNGNLHARLNNETWMIAPDGKLQQTNVALPPPEKPTSQGPYEISLGFPMTLEVQWKNSLIGNFDLGPSTETYVWLPQNINIFK